ncbi:MAG: phosphate/phosphite/phosphonate ABC transporter substrate-binding protein [Firmicutes bacterium]|nr:phosphate/phosphite/phosphonate ABC transporter substrate-binding protein [Bacillota bacterium]
MVKRVLRGLALALGLALGLTACGSSGGGGQGGEKPPEKLTVGFVPSSEAQKIGDTVKPICAFLEKELGMPAECIVSTDYVGLVEAMGSRQVDVGFLNPLGYVLAHSENGTEVLLKTVRRGSVTYNAQIVVRADSGIKSLADLRGKRFAFVDPASTSGYLYPVYYLMKNAGLKTVDEFFSEIQFLTSHDNVIKAVYNGDFDAGATFEDARTRVEKELPDVMEKVVVLAKVEGIPNDTISVRQGLPAELVAKIKDAFLKYAQTEEGKQVLFDLYQIDGFAEAKHEDYQPIEEVARAMNIDLREQLSK